MKIFIKQKRVVETELFLNEFFKVEFSKSGVSHQLQKDFRNRHQHYFK
jgi:hypothetical protein